MSIVASAVPVPTPTTESAPEPETIDVDALVTRVTDRVESLRRELTLVIGDLKVLRRAAKRVDRTRRKRTLPDDPDRKPSGFARPSELSDELCDFLHVERGTQLARTDVTRMVCKYIKDNNLNSEANRRSIDFTKPGAGALKQLLEPESGAVVTYFNLQRYLKRHIKSTASASASATPTATVTPTVTVTPTPTATATATPEPETAQRKRAKRDA
jgi:chromatin remodeling complex protein RSC6